MWTISKKRCLLLQCTGGYYNTNTNFIQNLTLPTRYDGECLDYALDISAFLQDSVDLIGLLQAEVEGMELTWLSYGQSCILFGLHGGISDKQGILFFSITTLGGRSFEITLTQNILLGRFKTSYPPNPFIPNLVSFSNTQPLRSSDEAFFFFG